MQVYYIKKIENEDDLSNKEFIRIFRYVKFCAENISGEHEGCVYLIEVDGQEFLARYADVTSIIIWDFNGDVLIKVAFYFDWQFYSKGWTITYADDYPKSYNIDFLDVIKMIYRDYYGLVVGEYKNRQEIKVS
ncbi:MAG: hypothetical protein FWC41_09790 [Firmicutes bacterium]|nr:hypothetical protein [Bacillota bacterium]